CHCEATPRVLPLPRPRSTLIRHALGKTPPRIRVATGWSGPVHSDRLNTMTNPLTTEPDRRPRGMVALGFAGLLMSALAMLILHVIAPARISPVHTTLSNYVFVAGYGWLFPAAVLGTAVAGCAIRGALRPPAVNAGALLQLTVTLASVCCLLVALFPTDRAEPVTLSAQIHRYAAGVACCCVPVAAWLLARRLSATGTNTAGAVRLHRTVCWNGAFLAMLLVSQTDLAPEAVQQLRGLLQRVQV